MPPVHWHREFNWSDIGPGRLASGAEGCRAILIFKSGDGLPKPLRPE